MEFRIDIIEYPRNPDAWLGFDRNFCAVATLPTVNEPIRLWGMTREGVIEQMRLALPEYLRHSKAIGVETLYIEVSLPPKEPEAAVYDITKVGKGRLTCRSED